MENAIHPLAPHHLPRFIPGPDGDPLFTVVLGLLIILLMFAGIMYFKLHAIPERLAHKSNNTQLQFITILAILALFTHNNIFWVAALLLAVVRFPDFSTPLNSIANSLEALAASKTGGEAKPAHLVLGDSSPVTDTDREESR